MVAVLWSHREATVALHVADTGGQLRIQWDRSAPAVRRARAGRLEIQDGNSRVQIALGPDQLRNGNVVYERRAGSVLVRLVVEREGAPALETLTQYVGADPPPPAPTAARSAALVLPARNTAHRAARSGAILWTGALHRHAVVQIDGASVSAGYLNGSLPAAPLRVAVLPARLFFRGLLVYSRGPQRGTEPPPAANGWNRTTYVEDAELARSITLLEVPGPQNGWKRLVFRCESRFCALAMIRWEAR